MKLQPTASHFVNGTYLEDVEGTSFDTVDPATGETLATLKAATPSVVSSAARSAQMAQCKWAATPPAERGRVLKKAAALLKERNDSLARLESFDTGKPIQETLVSDPSSAAECFDFYADVGSALDETVQPLDGGKLYTRREPLGICAGIGAWNYPIQIASWKAAPALAAGNAMIFKPSDLTPLSALKLAEILIEAGLPRGIFNVVQGGREVGEMLVSDPLIAKVSLTGSVATGKAIMRSAAQTLKHITLELGGKSPLIVFEDADLDDAVSGALMGNFYSSGQICSNCTRVFVHEEIYPLFMEKLVKRTKAIKLGNPLDPETQMGPLISRAQYDKVLSYIAQGVDEGATILTGGRSGRGIRPNQNWFIEPTIFVDVDDHMTIAREEIFGPVMCVFKFRSDEEVIRRANDSRFGLAGGLFTQDLSRAKAVASRLHSGICWVNTYNEYPIAMPFGGYKESGLGRENGILGLLHYTQVKSVFVRETKMESSM
jgi:betaine-aldehyde dehydrogenase